MSEHERMYIVWEPTSAFPPKVRYATREKAEQVAASMAVRYGKLFYVCQLVSVAVTQNVVVKALP